MGLGLRPPNLPSYGQGPSMQALAQQHQQQHQHPNHMHGGPGGPGGGMGMGLGGGAPSFVPPNTQRVTNLFVGSISAGIPDAFLNGLLVVSVSLPISDIYPPSS
jgi:RNA-binding protein 25